MRYLIAHTTRYQYSQSVRLGAHTLRLRPRSDGSQRLQQFTLQVLPQPDQVAAVLDLEGNACIQVWFPDGDITQLQIQTTAEVETYRTNPFDYLVEPWAVKLPLDYPSSLAAHLNPYLQPPRPGSLSPQVIDFAYTLLNEVQGNVSFFLTQLTQHIYKQFEYFHRPLGDPHPPGITIANQAGSCRDFAVLFMAVCQAVGLAARFVSGYQEGDLEQESRELHAWPEVYIPGGGWRGFDPTHGLAVSDRHIALAAAAFPLDAAPVAGTFQPGSFAQSTLEYQIQIQRLD